MCSGSEAGSYLRLIDFVYHSTLGLRVISGLAEAASLTRKLQAGEHLLSSKSAAHRDKSREWNVSKQKWNLC